MQDLPAVIQVTQKPSIFMMVLLISFGTVNAILFTPGLPSLALFFDISTSQAQLAISIYMLGYALGQIPYGPLANVWGRKNALSVGIGLQILGTLLCIISIKYQLFGLMLIGRLVMALGASVGLMMAFTLLNVFYEQQEARVISSKLMASFAILPGVALCLGGLICEHLAWYRCFEFLLIYGFLTWALVVCFVPEPRTAHAFNEVEKNWMDGLCKAARNKTTLRYAFLMGGSTAIIYIYNALSPFLSLQELGLSASQFGLYSALPPLGILFGSILSTKLNRYLAGQKVIKIGAVVSLILTINMLYWISIAPNIFIFFGSMTLIYCALTLVISNASVLSSAATQDKANGSGVMNFINMSCGAIGVGAVQLFSTSLTLLPFAIIITLVMMLLITK